MMMKVALMLASIPSLAVILAGIVAVIKKPTELVMNLIRVFAGGVLLGGLAANLVPELDFKHDVFYINAAILLALALMWVLKKISPECCGHEAASGSKLSIFLTAFAIEFLLNGMLIAFSVTLSQATGVVVAISLALCCFSCGMAVAGRLTRTGWSWQRRMLMMIALALLFPIGVIIIMSIHGGHVAALWFNIVLAFAIGILIYIAITDLIVPGFSKNNGRFVLQFVFFIGLVLVFMLKGIG